MPRAVIWYCCSMIFMMFRCGQRTGKSWMIPRRFTNISKAALGYREEENRIGARERDWVVGMPEIGFVYPAFSKRSADVNAMLYYAKGESHPEMISGLLGCTPCRTSAEEKLMFEDVVNDAFGDMQEQAETAYMFICTCLCGVVWYGMVWLLLPLGFSSSHYVDLAGLEFIDII